MKTNFPLLIANGLKEHCATWGYSRLEKLQENNTFENFYKLFCKITKTYYIEDSIDYYNVEFFKDGTVTAKKCGPDFDKREPDVVLHIKEILPLLVEDDLNIKKFICPICGKGFCSSEQKEKYCSVECFLWEELKNTMEMVW